MDKFSQRVFNGVINIQLGPRDMLTVSTIFRGSPKRFKTWKLIYGQFNSIAVMDGNSVLILLFLSHAVKLPPPNMLEAVHNLIDYGVSKEFIAKDFKLLGHRQVRDTECPGDRLFDEITTWPHWSAFPSQSNKKINVWLAMQSTLSDVYIIIVV